MAGDDGATVAPARAHRRRLLAWGGLGALLGMLRSPAPAQAHDPDDVQKGVAQDTLCS